MKTLATKNSSQNYTPRQQVQVQSSASLRSPNPSSLATGIPLLQRQCACGGGCPRCQEKLGIQTKISEPGDRYEQEADRIADEVMQMPEPTIQRQVELEAEQEKMVQAKADKPTKQGDCQTGKALHWGCETTCSLYGFKDSQTPFTNREGTQGETDCCNKWPPFVEDYARAPYLALNGVASCRRERRRQIAVVKYKNQAIRVACMDTIPKDKPQLIELSPKAAIDLYGGLKNATVEVCYENPIADSNLCYTETPTPKNPRLSDCVEKRCAPQDPSAETCENYGWPKV